MKKFICIMYYGGERNEFRFHKCRNMKEAKIHFKQYLLEIQSYEDEPEWVDIYEVSNEVRIK